ncbi:H(+)-transporting V1 sector ATPase subunit H [Linderina macrospora]|uniref:H(+)-transporting V1 sector ATPase subunit H n=1 Tax=Linderina macrospora TaxID=4868 RepID=A0ACC1JF04_9FUNG|nr:H(+)-transporting V1 sector ATPase subunit H [Linderina macrospora]
MTAIPDVPAAMVNNQFFDEFTDKVRVKPIPWEGYSRAGLISSTELGQLKEFQQQQQQGTAELSKFAPLLLHLVERLSSIDAQQYLLVCLDDLVENRSSSRPLDEAMQSGELSRILFRCMDKKDDYLGLKAGKILVGMVATSDTSVQREFAFARLFAYLAGCMQSELASVGDVAIQIVQSALRVRRARSVLYTSSPACMTALVGALKNSVGQRGARGVVAVPQTQYAVVFCLWLLTFERSIAVRLDKQHEVVPVMVEIARNAVKEKVVRIIVATWHNMLAQAASANVPGMLAAKVPGCLATLTAGRNFKDADLRAEIKELAEEMAGHAGVMTTWDEYVNEVRSGRLEWSPAHRSEQFWKLHVRKMDEDDHRVVRDLAKVLETGSGETVLAVACHDLAQYVKFNPDGKRLLARIGAKARVMAMMTSEHKEVRYEALLCVQQIMLNAWQN